MNKFRLSLVLFTSVIILLSATSCKRESHSDKLSVDYEKYIMPNGLQVILHEDHSDPMMAYAIMYHVGSSREIPGKTGFAHLFEHLLFGGSENVEPGKFDLVIEGVGGSNNGFTSRDVTTYFEMFPKNALEKVLWLESDRMGFFINSVTQRLLAIQQNVVLNEKRQTVDNAPYGFTQEAIYKNLYPEDHPYRWDVIGDMEDLRNSTLDDVRNFYEKFYGPNNATLVIAGDFNPDSVKILLDKYFGEIKGYGKVEERSPMPVRLEATKKVYHEDNFANVPEINMVWPVPESYNKDMYPLDFLAKVLSEGKKAPMYNVLVKEKQLTSSASAYNSSSELTGEFTISIRANEGHTLKEIEEAVFEAFGRFEKDGITDKDVERIKATSEMSFYQGLNSVFYKALNLAFYNTFLKDPGFIEKDIENIKAVTKEDIIRVYNEYIKNKPYVVTSFVPKGMAEMAADNSIPAVVAEENINDAAQVEIADDMNEAIVKTPSLIDRTTEPPAGPEPEVKVPAIWKAQLYNGIEVFGIQNDELPLVNLSIVLSGGAYQDRIELPGVSNLVAAVMPQGTKNKTPEELEEEIELLGSGISMYSGREEMHFEGATLSRNFDRTISLMKEILLEPRWDSSEFVIARTRALNSLIQSEAQPSSVASRTFYRLIYGTDNIFGYDSRGTRESMEKITINDLKEYYDRNFSPTVTRVLVAGNVTQEEVMKALAPLASEWKPKEVVRKSYPEPVRPEKSTIFFVDIPGSRQSVIYLGYPAIKRDNPDYIKTSFINYRLGGAFTSIFNQILREEKGFTYGASSSFLQMGITAPFVAATSVRSDATYESLKIFRDEMEKYREGISPEDLQFIKNCMIRSNALNFETNANLVGMLSTMTKYGFPEDFIKCEEDIIRNMTIEEHRAITQKYIIPDRMYYVVVGDAATQMKPLEKIGFGKPVLKGAKQ
ncbi:MAG TPA: pitrilysin family protein [Bacteroidales bacterium]|nr:pitrilysin family protein [Bacteroidales bacterium]